MMKKQIVQKVLIIKIYTSRTNRTMCQCCQDAKTWYLRFLLNNPKLIDSNESLLLPIKKYQTQEESTEFYKKLYEFEKIEIKNWKTKFKNSLKQFQI